MEIKFSIVVGDLPSRITGWNGSVQVASSSSSLGCFHIMADKIWAILSKVTPGGQWEYRGWGNSVE